MEPLTMLLLYFVTGFGAGLFGGLLGLGGGLIVMPVLVALFSAQHIAEPLVMPLALGTSMASIVFTGLASTRAHHARGTVNWLLVRKMALGLASGALLGSALVGNLSSATLKVFFLLFATVAATQMLLVGPPQAHRILPGRVMLFGVGGAIACICSLVGCGTATMAVPFMTGYSVPLRSAIGTTSAMGLPIGLFAVAGYIYNGIDKAGLPAMSLGYVYLPALLAIALGSALAAPLGATLSHRLPVAALKKFFALFLYVVAGKMLAAMT